MIKIVNQKTLRKIKYIMLMMLIIMTMTSCKRGAVVNDFRLGTEGIELSFVDMINRDVYLEGDYLRLSMIIKNKGSYHYPIGKVYLSGYDKNAVFFTRNMQEIPPLEGKTPENPEGEFISMNFEEEQPLKVPYGTEYNPVIQATACYEYQTKAFSTVCIIPDTKHFTQGKAKCIPETKTLSSQGAPVAITKVEQRISQNYMQFIVAIENVGKGTVVDIEQLGDCPFNLNHNKINKVEVAMAISGLGDAQCENENIITLYEGKGTAICKFITRPGPEYYETPLTIELNYGYANSIKKDIHIANPFYK